MPRVLDEIEASRMGSFEIVKKDKLYITARSMERSYYVLGDTLDDTEEEIVATVGVPPLWSLVSGMVCMKVDPKAINRVIHPQTGVPAELWEVKTSFDSDIDLDAAGQGPQSPDALRPSVRWSSETEEETLDRDAITGLPITTAADEKIIVTAPTYIKILTIRRYETYPWDPDIGFFYEGRVNSTPFYDAPVGTALLSRIEVDEETIEGELWAVVEYEIKFKLRNDPANPSQLREDTWMGEVLHQGYMHRNEDTLKKERALDDNDNPILVNLTAEGFRLTDTAPPEAASFVRFNRFSKVNLNTLNLGPFV